MTRRLVLGLLLVAAFPGCRTCDNPYDYCGPVVDSAFDSSGFRAGGAMAGPTVRPEVIPAPPPPPVAPPGANGVPPGGDAPPPMGELESTSVMRSRLRYAR